MTELLQDPAVQGGVLPFLFAFVLTLLIRLVGGRTAGNRFAILGAVVAFLCAYWVLEGMAPFPPVASKQKLIYLAAIGIVLGFVLELAWAGRASVLIVGGLYTAGALYWYRERNFARGFELEMLVELLVLWVAGLFIIWRLDAASRRGDLGDDAPEHRGGIQAPILMLAAGFAAGIVSFLGAFLGFAQLSIAIGAIFGAFVLINYVQFVRTGRALAFGPIGVLGAGGAWISGCYVAALFGGDVNPWALACLVLIFAADFVAARIRVGSGRTAAIVEPLVYGVVVAVPAVAAMLIAYSTYDPSPGY